MHAVIVGAGLGGLAAALALRREGWSVTVLEQAPVIGEVGAGIRVREDVLWHFGVPMQSAPPFGQVPPNGTRILTFLGLRQEIEKYGCKPLNNRTYRWDNRAPIQLEPWGYTENVYGYPGLDVHRADVHKSLLDAAIAPTSKAHPGLPVEVLTNSIVTSVDCEKVIVGCEGGRTFRGDLIVGADGVRSVLKKAVTGESDNAKPSGDQAFRFLIPVDKIRQHSELAFALEPASSHYWGPDKHIVMYPIRSGKIVNVVAICPDDSESVESWNADGSLDEVLKIFQGWSPLLLKLLSLGEDFKKWKLAKRAPLKTWRRGRTCLLGDASHAMLPYLAQGAATAFEDAVVLARSVSALGVERGLKVYEELRLPRTAQIQSGADASRKKYHLHDGPEQMKRDDLAKKKWNEVPELYKLAWGYDAIKMVEEAIGRELGKAVTSNL
ncbi:hypothetical protein HDU93_000744 [Gonapodya sp. JEL0774]|nr:hypothetical protein HDU93_000744 [Gonapodya sp. JEL0774]